MKIMKIWMITGFAVSLQIRLFSFEFSGRISMISFYQSVSNAGLLNRNDILELPGWNCAAEFEAKVSDKLFNDKNRYYFKTRDYYNFTSDYKSLSNNSTNYEGRTLFGIDEFYLDYEATPRLYFLAGKERAVWGNGFLFNPADVINPVKDRNTPVHDEEGVLMFKTAFLNENYGLDLYVIPCTADTGTDIYYSGTAAAMKIFAGVFNIDSCLYYYENFDKNKPKFGITMNYMIREIEVDLYSDLIFDNENSYTYFKGSDMNFDSYEKNNSWYVSGVAGLSYSKNIGFQFNVCFEYFYNEKGCSAEEKMHYFDCLKSNYDELEKIKKREGQYEYVPGTLLDCFGKLEAGKIKYLIGLNKDFYLNRHYLGVNLSLNDIYHLFDITGFLTYSLPDFDLLSYQEFRVNFRDNFNIGIYCLESGGNAWSQYGNYYFNYMAGSKMNIVF